MTPGRILVADDEESIRFVLEEAFRQEGFRVSTAADGEAALAALLAGEADAAFVDIRMPGLDGLELLRRLREAGRSLPVVVITAQDTMENAVEAMKQGAYDYLTKPFDLEKVCALARRALEVRHLARDLERLEREMRTRFSLGVGIVGRSSAMQEIYKAIGRLASTDVTVLLQGESGTGKELVAKAIHYHSRRWSGPFVPVNCAAVPRELLESELFGHEKGAFTGALETRVGKFEQAQGGTLFLDEIGEMPLELQTKLLRVLEDREVWRVGGRAPVSVDCRIVAATNLDLEKAVAAGRFRADLYYRLNVVPLKLPPLRERREDIPELVRYFVEKVNRELGLGVRGVSESAIRRLRARPWPGNVRELENTIVRAAVLAPGRTLTDEDFGFAEAPRPDYRDVPLDEVLRARFDALLEKAERGELEDTYRHVLHGIEKPLLARALERTGGNQLRAAALLGLNRNTLRKKMVELGLATQEKTEGRSPVASSRK
ncbi:MAG: acetoacetate metabolism regulatory protein AtoC [Candidatus Binatia bacterium]|nr:MAG: acetoacetate metabolism regulatory protein AtoC [Candidatus Binatia bacterium]